LPQGDSSDNADLELKTTPPPPIRCDWHILAIGSGFIMRDVHLAAYKKLGLPVEAITGKPVEQARKVNLTDVKLGFRPDNLVTTRTLVVRAPASRARLVDAILERVEALPGVVSAGTIQFLPLTGFTNHGPFQFVGRPLPANPSVMESDVSTVSREYFESGMELLRRRPFGCQDQMDSPRVELVNRAFVNQYSRSSMTRARLRGEGFLKSYMREDYATLLSTLDETHAIVFGRASSCTEPVLVRPKRGVDIARLLFVVDKIPKHERDRVRRDLLDYCHQNALARVRLVETLEGLARVAP